MRKSRVQEVLVLIVLLYAAVCISCAKQNSSTSDEADAGPEARKDGIVAVVNGQPIHEDRLTPYLNERLKSVGKFSGGKTSELAKELRGGALEKVIEDELIYQESLKLIIPGLEEQVEGEINAMKSKHESEEAFQEGLGKMNQTMEGLRDSVKGRIRITEYLKQKGVADPEIPEEEIRAFYDQEPDSYSREASVDVSHILIPVDQDASSEQWEGARKEAAKLRKEILSGQDFGEMAKKHSSCNSASGGGRLGPVKKGYMPIEFEDAAFSMEKEQVSEPVRTKFGYHLILVHENVPAGPVPYEQVRDFIRKFLQERASKTNLTKLTSELRQNAKIEIFLDES